MPESKGEVRPQLVPNLPKATWRLRLHGDEQVWDWAEGAPDLHALEPLRRPRSGAKSRHIPVRAFTFTTGDYVEVESGLEHDLVRLLDRDDTAVWLVGQPFELDWPLPGRKKRRRHTPDLLSMDPSGRVTVWDVKRPENASSDDFAVDRAATESACADVGWAYQVFTGLSPQFRHNLMWLHSYRRRPAWAARYESELIAAASGGCRLADLVTSIEPERSAVMWHLIWTNRLHVDLSARLCAATEVSA